MRCLYCGKELALLKRWTGGGEFCSDAHRQRYQEEYNQLALNRLLQAKPPSKSHNEPSQAAESKPVPVQKVEEPAPVKVAESPKNKPVYHEEPVKVAAIAPQAITPLPEPEPEPEPEVVAPAELAGFFVEIPLVALAEAPFSQPDLAFLAAAATSLPSHAFEPLNARAEYQLGAAGLVSLEPSNRVSNYASSGSRDRRLEVREFVRTAPVVEINLNPAGETGLETSSEAMDILIFPQPPQGSPALWQESAVRFCEAATELGTLARLSFGTTGFSGADESSVDQSSAPASDPQESAVAVAPEAPVESAPEIPVIDEEVLIEQPAPELPSNKPSVEIATDFFDKFLNSPKTDVAQEVTAPVEIEPEPPKPADPDPATIPLPLTLHATTPGRGKPVQIFSSAVNRAEAQLPRSTALPLRPVMTIGPAPAKPAEKKPEPKAAEVKAAEPKAPEPKIEAKKPAPAPVRPDPRIAAKLRAPALEVQESKKAVAVAEPPKDAAPKPAAKADVPPAVKTAARADARQEKKPEEKAPEPKEPMNIKEEPKPVPTLSAPYPGSSDLGLPQLNLATSSGFLGQVPMVAKIGIAVVLLAGIGGLIAYTSKSGGAAMTGGPGTVIAGSALPTGETGWITDWGAEAGVRRTRQISILRSSQTLTDYRIEMEAQIESKAVGWVFRAQDPKNFYVTKLEIIKPGLEPTVALVRWAVINGEEQPRAQLPLPITARLDTLYKIRFDALGDHFTTYVQDQKVDDWTDDRVKTGGVGIYRDRGEDASLKGGMNVVPLTIKR